MKETNLNAELLAVEARGRKHIPVAVFVVILIHVLLFLVLLIAAGCRAKARARQQQQQEMMSQAAVETNAPPLIASEPVVATEPVVEPEGETHSADPRPNVRTAAVTPVAARAVSAEVRTTGLEQPPIKTYVVQPGDNLGAIARRHGTTVKTIKKDNNLKNDFIKAGQQLRVRLEKASRPDELAMR